MRACCCLLGLCLATSHARAEPDAGWILLQDEQVRIQCRPVAVGTECEASANLSAGVDHVASVIADLQRWPEIFASVREVRPITPGIWGIDVELPFPLGRWPLIASVVHDREGAAHHIQLIAQGDEAALWSHASWRVTARGSGSQLQYLWRSDALRRLPAPLRRVLLRRTGHNTLWGVALAVGAQPTAP